MGNPIEERIEEIEVNQKRVNTIFKITDILGDNDFFNKVGLDILTSVYISINHIMKDKDKSN